VFCVIVSVVKAPPPVLMLLVPTVNPTEEEGSLCNKTDIARTAADFHRLIATGKGM
jgi:hypothetical protein